MEQKRRRMLVQPCVVRPFAPSAPSAPSAFGTIVGVTLKIEKQWSYRPAFGTNYGYGMDTLDSITYEPVIYFYFVVLTSQR